MGTRSTAVNSVLIMHAHATKNLDQRASPSWWCCSVILLSYQQNTFSLFSHPVFWPYWSVVSLTQPLFLTIYSLTFTHTLTWPRTHTRFLHHPFFFSSPSEYNMCNFKNWIGPRLVIVFPALVGNYNIIPLFWPWFSLIIRLLYILQLTHIDVTLAVFFSRR